METALRNWLIAAGFPHLTDLRALQRGLGSTETWSFVPSPGAQALVSRVFGEGSHATAEREFLAMTAAAHHSLPVPAIVSRGQLNTRPLLVTTFVPGSPAIQVLCAHPLRANAIGLAMGETLGRLHDVTAPDAFLLAQGRSWIDRGGLALGDVRRLLDAVPNQDRLLHLDYHPENAFLQDDRVTGIIDWENATAGPPHMDLARSRAILRAAQLGTAIPPESHAMLAQFEDGLVAGHARYMGDDPHPELSTAWGLAMTAEDLTGQIGKGQAWITQDVVDRLAAERDELIRTLTTESMHPR